MGHAAVLPWTDLARHARTLRQVHHAVMAGGAAPVPVQPVVERSWSRVLRIGLDPTRPVRRDPLPRDEVERRRRDSPLHLVVDDMREVLSQVADASHFIVVVTDRDGVILWREGAPRVLLRADALGFDLGATWTEECVGTNAIGTALAEQAPVQLFSAEHFEEGQHPWYCTASPLHDPRTGELLGVVDVSGPALTLHPAIRALVSGAARLAQEGLRRHHDEALHRLRRQAEQVLPGAPGPAVVVDRDGWVAAHVGVAAGDRVPVPRDGLPVLVPGLGLCVPEPLGEGWLLRPRRPAAVLRATLSRAADGAGGDVLEVRSGEGVWIAALSPRHASILRLLHAAGPQGLSAAELSRALFGDADHQVTVRAEISRLRRVAGSVVSAAPYRVSAAVRLTVGH